MATQMVRKQIYIQKRQNTLLKRLSQATGQSEAEIIRQAIEREISGGQLSAASDLAAWEQITAFVAARQAQKVAGHPYRWNREEIYAERSGRRLRETDEEGQDAAGSD